MKLKLRLLFVCIFFASFSFAQNLPYYVPKSGIELWYPLNKGLATDSSGNMRDGILSRINQVAGHNRCVNSALYFSNAGDSLTIHHGPNLLFNQYTISIWSNANPLDTNTHSLISWNDSTGGFQLGIKNNLVFFDYNKTSIQASASTNTFNFSLGANKAWHHYVLAFSTGVTRVYIDTLLVGVVNGTINLNSSNNIYIGNSLYGEGLNGAVEDLGWWNRLLSKNEINDLYFDLPLQVSTRAHNASCGTVNSSAAVLVTGVNLQNCYYMWTGSTLPNFLYGNGDSIAVTSSGLYNFQVYEQNDRCVVGSVNLTVPVPMSVQNILNSAPACYGDSNGVLIESVSGGTVGLGSQYNLSWSPAISTNDTAYHVPQGTYVFTASDDNGCFVMDTVMVQAPAALSFKVNRSSQPSCVFSANGNIQVVPQGGTAPYYYVWGSSNGAVTAFAGNALYCANGNYAVYITDAHNCFIAAYDTFNQKMPCIYPVVIPPYMSNSGLYAWYPFNNNALDESGFMNFGSNFGGTFVNNRSNCVASAIALNSNPTLIQDSVALGTGYAFNLNQFSISAWLQTNNNPADHNATIFSNLNSAGNGYWIGVRNDTIVYDLNRQNGVLNARTSTAYINPNKPSLVTLTYDANVVQIYIDSALVYVDSFVVLGLAPNCRALVGNTHYGEFYAGILDDISVYSRVLSASEQKLLYNYSPITAGAAVTNNVCGGAADGKAFINVNYNGHVANNVQFNWTPNVSSIDSAIHLLAGNYQCVVIADYMNCATVNFTVTQPTPIQIIVDSTYLEQDCAGQFNGYIAVHAAVGGVPPYNYAWSNGALTPAIQNLANGSYSILVTDANNCHAYDTFMVLSPAPLQANLSKTNITCGASNDATLSLTVNGGLPSYAYAWTYNMSPLAGNTATQTNLGAGSYSCQVSDIHNCSITIFDTILAGPAADFVLVEPRDTMQYWTSSLSLNVVSSNSAVNYQWQVDSLGNWVNCHNGFMGLNYTGVDSNYLEIFITALHPTMGRYRCVLSDSLCSDTTRTASVDFEFEGVENVAGKNIYKVYWSDDAHQNIHLLNNNFNASQIELRNSIGQLIYRQSVHFGVNQFPTPALNDGLYLISISDSNNKVLYNTKLVK